MLELKRLQSFSNIASVDNYAKVFLPSGVRNNIFSHSRRVSARSLHSQKSPDFVVGVVGSDIFVAARSSVSLLGTLFQLITLTLSSP